MRRAAALGLLLLCGFALYRLRAQLAVLPPHPPTVPEMLTSFAAVFAGLAGAMMLASGATLFRSRPEPRDDGTMS